MNIQHKVCQYCPILAYCKVNAQPRDWECVNQLQVRIRELDQPKKQP